jgi:hypothetical protein
MTFKAVIHPEPAGGYWGEVPALPGCYSQGETVEELLANLRKAAASGRPDVPAARPHAGEALAQAGPSLEPRKPEWNGAQMSQF